MADIALSLAGTVFVDPIGDPRVPDFDGDLPGYDWTGATHASPSVQILPLAIFDDVKVIDSILVDPVTPGIYFNIYYSSEGYPGANEGEWENKMWTHVPATFHATEKRIHTLPEPILAKYVKIEFSHLQAKSYSPGDFAKPIRYKKHPKWVLDYFLARLETDQSVIKKFNSRVGVVHNAIDLAYNYYLDDLNQEPNKPVEVDTDYSAIQRFLNQRNDLSDQVDSITLSKINLSLKPYRDNPVYLANQESLMGRYAIASAPTVYSAETDNTSVVFPDLVELRSESVVFESDFPIMSFYITCRHKYREVIAAFSHDRAYFAGVNEVAFLREQYTTSFDSEQYQEPAGDLVNTEVNDFTYIDGAMVIG